MIRTLGTVTIFARSYNPGQKQPIPPIDAQIQLCTLLFQATSARATRKDLSGVEFEHILDEVKGGSQKKAQEEE